MQQVLTKDFGNNPFSAKIIQEDFKSSDKSIKFSGSYNHPQYDFVELRFETI